MLAGGHGELNPNAKYLKSRGLWLSYSLGMIVLHIIILSIPVISTQMAWTITNLIHNSFHFVFLHTLKGSPWMSTDQGEYSVLTHWEQIDHGKQFTKTRKFLTLTPVVMFFLTCFYTRNDPSHFAINFLSVLLVTLPKHPLFHGVRLFGINRY